jgi:hypothetical protein
MFMRPSRRIRDHSRLQSDDVEFNRRLVYLIFVTQISLPSFKLVIMIK